MDEHTAVFEVTSRSDAYAVERLVDEVYNAIREELQTATEDGVDSDDPLDQFERLRDATRRRTPATLTLTYAPHDEALESSDHD